MKVDNTDVIDDKCVKDKNNNLVLGDKTKLHVLKADYEKLLNMKFDWDNNSLSIEPSVKDFAIKITKDMAAEAVLKLKEGKAYGQSEIVIEMVKAGGDTILDVITDMINLIIKEEQILKDYDHSTKINCFKGKGDSTRCGNYQRLKLLEHSMKVMEGIVDAIIREREDIDSTQFGFNPGHSTTDVIFILKQMLEKHHLKRSITYDAFVDLEKAFD